MSPEIFLGDIVQPNVSALQKNRQSLQFSVNAILALDAFFGVFHAYLLKTSAISEADDSKFRDCISDEFSQYAILRDMAFALKHGALNSKKPRLVRYAENIKPLQIGAGTFHCNDPIGVFEPIYIVLENGARHRAIHVCSNVLRKAQQLIDPTTEFSVFS